MDLRAVCLVRAIVSDDVGLMGNGFVDEKSKNRDGVDGLMWRCVS